VVAQANYGGRVTDDKDVRLISAMLRKYFCPEVMNDSYKLSKLDTYYAPPEGTLAECRTYIEGLPLDEDPEVFGLHPNANIQYEKNLVALLSDTVLMMQPRVSASGSGKSPDERAQDLAREIVAKVPDNLDIEKAHETTFAISSSGAMVSLGVFLGQEIERFNVLLKTMRFTLDQLDKAIQGTVVMSAGLEEMAGKFLINKVPSQWEGVGYPSLKPLGSWVEDLILRIEFCAKWLYNGVPDSYWVPAFYFPQGFMTAAMQTYARKSQIPIDALQFRTNVRPFFEDDVKVIPEDGVNVHGLFLQGAQWSMKTCTIEDSAPGQAIVKFPCIWLEPVDVNDNIEGGCYSCPLYKTSTRRGELSTTGHSTNFVSFL